MTAVSGGRAGMDIVLVSGGVRVNFFSEAGKVLCFGFRVRMVLIRH